MNRRPALWILLALATLVPACIPEGLAFVEDDRVEIVAPESHTEVDLPVTIEWTVEDFEVTGPGAGTGEDSGYFAVFVDTPPVPPGDPLEWIARDDKRCENTPGCPDEVYFADRNVFSTTETEFTVEHLPDMETATGHEIHEVTIVLLDETGRRIGESAWHITFFFQRAQEDLG